MSNLAPAAVFPSLATCRKSIYVFVLFMALGFAAVDRVAPGGRRLAKVAGVDTVNYFGISHSLLFDHDFNLNNEFQRLHPTDREWTYVRKDTGLPGSPWGVGYSILQTPLLALGTGLDWLAGNPADGYSPFAMYLYSLGNIFITGLGLRALFELLLLAVGESEAPACLFAVIAVFFGTNIGYYSLMPMSHASSFLFGTLFLLCWWKMRDGTELNRWFLLGMVGGVFSICRWQDVLYLGAPILYDLFNRHPFRDFLGWLRSRAVYAVGAFLCWIPQIIEWKMIYGKYLTLPQGGGFIKFPPTHVPDILFSTRGSWLLWTPLIMIGIAGLVIAVTRNWRLYVPWVSIVVLELLVIGAMDEWHGRDTFGSRYMLANTPVAALGLALLLAARNQPLRRAIAGISVLCALFTSLFLVQYTMKLIPQNEPLTPTQIFAEKLQIVRVARRKALVRGAAAALEGSDKAVVLEKLEQALDLGEDDVALRMAIPLYLAKGDSAKANQAQVRLAAIRAARLP